MAEPNMPQSPQSEIPNTMFSQQSVGPSQPEISDGHYSMRYTPQSPFMPLTPMTSQGSDLSQRMDTPALPRGDVGRIPAIFNMASPITPAITPGRRRGQRGGAVEDDTVERLGQATSSAGAGAGASELGGVEEAKENHMDEEQDGEDGSAWSVVPDTVIWGTTINAKDCQERFRAFLVGFKLDPEGPPLYMQKLEQVLTTQVPSITINCAHLWRFPASRQVYTQLVGYPREVVQFMDHVIQREFIDNFGNEPNAIAITKLIQVRPCNLRKIHKLRHLDPENIDQMVAVRGMITRMSPIIPDLKQAFFRCIICGRTTETMIDRGRIEEPQSCAGCQKKSTLELLHNRCLYSDKQLVRLQETPDDAPEGETPATCTLFSFDSLVDTVRPGDRVEVTGIFRAVPKRANPRRRVVGSVYKTYIDVVHFRRMEAGSISGADSDAAASGSASGGTGPLAFPEERIEEFKNIAKDPDVYENLTRAVAPSIWELDDVKKGVLCQLFGGSDPSVVNDFTQENISSQGGIGTTQGDGEERHGGMGHRGNRTRGEINVLLCGDPGTSKSQLLSYVHKIAPRGVYTSGKGSSAVGLTASVIRDPETREPVLESGALVLSDNGVCCIDEFDKMSDSTRAVLHEVMEQQTVSIAKAGIICTLNAKTAILASANPVESRYNPNLSVVDNIKLMPTLLSRFDLIYLVLDRPNPDSDRRLARHLVSLYYPDPDDPEVGVDQALLRDYIAYARQTCMPHIGDGAVSALLDGYLAMRRVGGQGSKTIAATPRQLESLIRISEALAKMRLASEVLESDVEEAVRLMRVATQAAATDPRTGTIDMDMITTGRATVDRDLMQQLANEVKQLLQGQRGAKLSLSELKRRLATQTDEDIQQNLLVEALKQLADDNFIQYSDRHQTVTVRG